MVIGIDASQANKNKKTGVEWCSYYLIQELKKIPLKSGNKFILYSQDGLQKDLNQLPDNWTSKVLKWPKGFFWTQIRLLWELKSNPPDIFFTPGYYSPFFNRVKSILIIHDLGLNFLKKKHSLKEKWIDVLLQRRAISKAVKIIVPCHFVKKTILEKFPVLKEKIEVIFEGYDQRRFNLEKNFQNIESVLKKYQIKKPYFLCVGRLEKRKNQINLIKAYKVLNKINSKTPDLVLVGKSGYGYQEIKKEILNNKGIKEVGYVSESELKVIYQEALAFIFPSLYEGFGLPILEAMACGIPVLASRIEPFIEIGEKEILFFNQNKFEEIANKMDLIIKDEELRFHLIKVGLNRVKYFSWQKMAEQLMDVFLSY